MEALACHERAGGPRLLSRLVHRINLLLGRRCRICRSVDHHESHFPLPSCDCLCFLSFFYLGTKLFLLLFQLRSKNFGAEVFGLEDWPYFNLSLPYVAIGVGGYALDPGHSLIDRFDLPQPEACDELFRLGEWAVDDG